MVYRVVSYDIGERRSVQDEENGPQYWALRHTDELWWWRRRVIDWSGLISVWEVWVKPLECSRPNAKNRVKAGEAENLMANTVRCQKRQKDPTKEEQKCCHCQSRAERILFTIRNKTVPMLCQSCSIGWLKGIAEVVFLARPEMGENGLWRTTVVLPPEWAGRLAKR